MPELQRYEILTNELIDRESHMMEKIENVIRSLPVYNLENKAHVLASITQKDRVQNNL